MRTEKHLGELEAPANLRINDQIKRYREQCRRMGCERPYHHFAFGQSPFAPPPSVVEALRVHAGEHDYLFVDWNRERERLRAAGLTTSSDVAEHALAVEHVAMLPGTALLLAASDVAFRCSYVDYDGVRALVDFRRRPPSTDEEKDAFVIRNAPLVTEGIACLGRYFEQVRAGKRPAHA